MNSNSIFDKFTIQDVLVYILPGAISFLPIYCIINLGNFASITKPFSLSISPIWLILLFSYPIGLILSAFSIAISNQIRNIRGIQDPRKILPVEYINVSFMEIFRKVFAIDISDPKEWNATYFYMVRVFVNENMPHQFKLANRQNTLFLFREYMIMPTVIWGMFGIIASINLFVNFQIFLGIAVVFFSFTFTLIIIISLFNRMIDNRERELREIYNGLVVWYKANSYKNIH